MKARIPQPKELVLLYGLDETAPRGATVRQLLAALRLEARTVTDEMLSQTVGWCAGLPGYPPQQEASCAASCAAPAEEAMVLCGLNKSRLDELLKALSENGISIYLKAVLTEHNCGWSFYELYQELRQEHEKMNAADGRGAAENTDGDADSRD